MSNQKNDKFELDIDTHAPVNEDHIVGGGVPAIRTEDLPDKGPDYFEARLYIQDHGRSTITGTEIDPDARDPEWVDFTEIEGVYRIDNFNDTISVGAETSKPFVFKSSSVSLNLFNKDFIFDNLQKATLKTVNGNDAKFLLTAGGSNYDLSSRPAKITGRFPSGEMTVETPLAFFNVDSISTDSDGNAKINLKSLEEPFMKKQANSVKDGRNWYLDRSVKFLAEELIKSVRREYETSTSKEVLPDGDVVSVAGIETPVEADGTQDRMFSEYGKPMAYVSPEAYDSGNTATNLQKGEKRLVVTAATPRNIFRSKLSNNVSMGSNFIRIRIDNAITIKKGDVLTIGKSSGATYQDLNEEKVTVLEDITFTGTTGQEKLIHISGLQKDHVALEIVERWIIYIGCTRDIEDNTESYILAFDPDRDEYANLTTKINSGNSAKAVLQYIPRFLYLKETVANEYGVPTVTDLILVGTDTSYPGQPNEDGNFLVWTINTLCDWDNKDSHLTLALEKTTTDTDGGIYSGEMNYRSMKPATDSEIMGLGKTGPITLGVGSVSSSSAARFGAMSLGQFVADVTDKNSNRYYGFGYFAGLYENTVVTVSPALSEVILIAPTSKINRSKDNNSSEATGDGIWGICPIYKEGETNAASSNVSPIISGTLFLIGTEENSTSYQGSGDLTPFGTIEGLGETFNKTLYMFSSRIKKCSLPTQSIIDPSDGTGGVFGKVKYLLEDNITHIFDRNNTIAIVVPDTGKMYMKNNGENLLLISDQQINFGEVDENKIVGPLTDTNYHNEIVLEKKNEIDGIKTSTTIIKDVALPKVTAKGYYSTIVQKKKMSVRQGDIIWAETFASNINTSGLRVIPAQYVCHPFWNEDYQYLMSGVGDVPPVHKYYSLLNNSKTTLVGGVSATINNKIWPHNDNKNIHIWSLPILGLWCKYDIINKSLFSSDGSLVADNGNAEMLGFWYLDYETACTPYDVIINPMNAAIPRVELAYTSISDKNLYTTTPAQNLGHQPAIIPHCTIVHNLYSTDYNTYRENGGVSQYIPAAVNFVYPYNLLTERLKAIFGGTWETGTTNFARNGYSWPFATNPTLYKSSYYGNDISYSRWKQSLDSFSTTFPLDFNQLDAPFNFNNRLIWRFCALKNPQADGNLFISPYCRPVRGNHIHLPEDTSMVEESKLVWYAKGKAAGEDSNNKTVTPYSSYRTISKFEYGSEDIFSFNPAGVYQPWCIDNYSQNKTIGAIYGAGEQANLGGMLKDIYYYSSKNSNTYKIVLPLGYDKLPDSVDPKINNYKYRAQIVEHKDHLPTQPSYTKSPLILTDTMFLSYYKIFFNVLPTDRPINNESININYPRGLYCKTPNKYYRYGQRLLKLNNLNNSHLDNQKKEGSNDVWAFSPNRSNIDYDISNVDITITINDGINATITETITPAEHLHKYYKLLDHIEDWLNAQYQAGNILVFPIKDDFANLYGLPDQLNFHLDGTGTISTPSSTNKTIYFVAATEGIKVTVTMTPEYLNTRYIPDVTWQMKDTNIMQLQYGSYGRQIGLTANNDYDVSSPVLETTTKPMEWSSNYVNAMAKWYLSREDTVISQANTILCDSYTPNFNSPYLNNEANLYSIVHVNPLHVSLTKWNYVKFCLNAQKNFKVDQTTENQLYFVRRKFYFNNMGDMFIYSVICKFNLISPYITELTTLPNIASAGFFKNTFDYEIHGLLWAVNNDIGAAGVMIWKNNGQCNLSAYKPYIGDPYNRNNANFNENLLMLKDYNPNYGDIDENGVTNINTEENNTPVSIRDENMGGDISYIGLDYKLIPWRELITQALGNKTKIYPDEFSLYTVGGYNLYEYPKANSGLKISKPSAIYYGTTLLKEVAESSNIESLSSSGEWLYITSEKKILMRSPLEDVLDVYMQFYGILNAMPYDFYSQFIDANGIQANFLFIKGWVEDYELYNFQNVGNKYAYRGIALRRHLMLSDTALERSKRESTICFAIEYQNALNQYSCFMAQEGTAFYEYPIQAIRKFNFRVTAEDKNYFYLDTRNNTLIKWNGMAKTDTPLISNEGEGLPVVEGDFGQYELPIKLDTPYEEIFGFSMGPRIHQAAMYFKGGRNIIWKFSKNLAFHIAVADFNNLTVWQTLSQFAELTNSIMSFDRFGYLHFEKRPKLSATSQYIYTFDKFTEKNVISINKEPADQYVYNYAEVIPYKPILGDPKINLTQNSDIDIIELNNDTFVLDRNIYTSEKTQSKPRPDIKAYQKDYERKRIILVCNDTQEDIKNPQGQGLYSRWKYKLVSDIIELRLAKETIVGDNYVIVNSIPFNDTLNRPYINIGDDLYIGNDGPYVVSSLDMDNKKIYLGTNIPAATLFTIGMPITVYSLDEDVFYATGDGTSAGKLTFSPKTFFVEIGEWAIDNKIRKYAKLMSDLKPSDTIVYVDDTTIFPDFGAVSISGTQIYFNGKLNGGLVITSAITREYAKNTLIWPMPTQPYLLGVYNIEYDLYNNLWRLGGLDEIGPSCLEEYHLYDPNEDGQPYYDKDPLLGGKAITALEFYWQNQKPISYADNNAWGFMNKVAAYYGTRHRTFVNIAIDFKNSRFITGDRIDIDLPGLQLVQQTYQKKVYSNYQSILRNGLKPYPDTGNRFFNNTTAIIHTKRIVNEFSNIGTKTTIESPISNVQMLDFIKIARIVDKDMFDGMPSNQAIGYISELKFNCRTRRATVGLVTQKI